MSNAATSPSHADELLRVREARTLSWSVLARLGFVWLFAILEVLFLVGILPPGIVAEGRADGLAMLGVLGVAIVSMTIIYRIARKGEHLFGAGLAAVIIDLVLLSALPFVWGNAFETPDGTIAFMMKNDISVVAIVFIVINSLTLRPALPLIMMAGALLMHAVVMIVVMADANVVISDEFVDHFYTGAVNPGVFIGRLIMLTSIGLFLAFLAKTARRTIHEAIDLELANFEIKEQQTEMIMDSRMAAMSGLVAGVAHEINTPLGALTSSLQTSGKAVDKLEGNDRIVGVLRDGTRTATAATGRIREVAASLKDFARLDEAELQRVDIHDGLDSTISLVSPETRGSAEIVRHFGDLPKVTVRAKEINQVFMTLVVNAFEAMDGEGTLTIKTQPVVDGIEVSITDTGPGIAANVLPKLFEVRFARSQGRMSMGLGLPMAQRIIQRHEGTIAVESQQGQGTTFRIQLPVS